MAEHIRNKYNTLTPAEAKKLNRFLAHRAPLRTASVLNKPRAPPIVVTNLDEGDELAAANTDQDQTITNNNDRESDLDQRRQNHPHANHHDSLSNLSFRSSRDTPDCVAIQRSFHTMSVDLSNRNQHHQLLQSSAQIAPGCLAHEPMRNGRLRSLPRRSNTLNTRISDDSFSSAKSDFFNISGRSSSVTPTKFSRFPPGSMATAAGAGGTPEPIRSASRPSLSSSTYKVFQSPLANFKRLFRGIQRPFSQSASGNQRRGLFGTQQQVASTKTGPAAQRQQQQQHQQQGAKSSLADFSLSDSISCASLNKSQSPTVLPPPPNELKSLGYIESGCIDYSNYDEFTKARNERLPRNSRPSSRSNESGAGDMQLSYQKSDDSDDSSWQMTSLPVYFERNLTTVFEEKQQQLPVKAGQDKLVEARQRRRLTQIISPLDLEPSELRVKIEGGERIYQSIKPPRRFDDSNSLVAEPSLEFQRRQPASPFRFSFGQPLSCAFDQTPVNTNLGLPPRLPTGQQQQPPLMSTNNLGNKINSENQSRHHDNSSSGNSSNCSSQMNVINYCDRQNALDSSTTATTTTSTTTGGRPLEMNSSVYSLEKHHDLCGNLDDLNDPNSTLQSESSTLHGDSDLAAFYASKFAEFERTVASLKNKLIVKEKELTELQLVQLNNDYTIERLKERLVKLERENQQLRTMATNNANRDIVF